MPVAACALDNLRSQGGLGEAAWSTCIKISAMLDFTWGHGKFEIDLARVCCLCFSACDARVSIIMALISCSKGKTLKRPVVLSFCATFLRREMLHVFRQMSLVQGFENWVVTRRLENITDFPYDRVIVLKKSPWRIFRRAYCGLFNRRVALSYTEVRQMLEISQKKNAGVVHVYLGTEAARLLPYLRVEKRAKVVSFHGADVSDSITDQELAAIFSNVDLLMVRSNALAEQLVARGCPPGLIRFNRTSVPLPDSVGDCAASNGSIRLLQACRFIPKKGIDTTLRAVAELVARGCDVELDLAGDGPELAELRRLVGFLGLRGRVRFLGFLSNEDLMSRFGSYSLFVHPSRTTVSGDQEGIPNSILEAMACGLPVVATSHSGIPEAMTDGVEGRLVVPDDAVALAEAILGIAQNPDLRRKMSLAARQRIVESFSAESAIAQLESVYREAMDIAALRTA